MSSSYQVGVPKNINFEQTCINDFLERTARDFTKSMALSFLGYTLTYIQLKNMVDRFATCLNAFGIKKGDSVAILLPNIIQCVVAYHAILKISGLS